MNNAVLALGTNLGDREKNIESAVEFINNIPGTSVRKVSSIYETEPFGVPNKQDNYLNCCILVQTELTAEMLLGAAFGVEAAMGRTRAYKNAPRVVDIDLLLYEGIAVNEEHITVPHPRIRERAFVMVPLKELFGGNSALNFDFAEDFKQVDKSGVNLYRKAIQE